MHVAESLSPSDSHFILILSITAAGYLGYYFLAFAQKSPLSIFKSKKEPIPENGAAHVFLQKLTGFFLMGILPYLSVLIFLPESPFHYGLVHEFQSGDSLYILVPVVILITLNIFFAGKPENLKQYPQMRISAWTPKIISLNAFGWAIYLLGYEYLFRGVFFFGVLPILGLYKTIALNTIVYSLAHLSKGAKETLGSIPLGILMCIITFKTGSIWATFLIHLAMAWSNEFLALYHHPDMYVKREEKLSKSVEKNINQLK